jgi:Tfp pilus assembly protein PilP
MKRAITILVCVLAAGMAAGQSPNIIRDTKNKMDGVRDQATHASNEALGITGPTSASAKGVAKQGAPAPRPVPAAAKLSAGPPKKSTAPQTAKAKKPAEASPMAAKPAPAESGSARSAAPPVASDAAAEPSKDTDNPEGKWAKTGKRDPFVSPVVYQSGNSNCTTGKKCLEIGAINLRGVVRSESGFIAVVTNSLNKAYFLRENDPVFDGYVVKITGDSIVFQETLQDRLGKAFTREVVKKITTPSV